MANIVINGKSVITQSSTDTPVLGPDILFPSGHIIQTVFGQTTASTTITSSTKGSGTPTTLSATIKANSITNKLLFFCNLLYYMEHSDIGFGVEIYDGSSVIYTDTTTNAYNRNSDGTERAGGRYNFMAYVTPTTTGSTNYSVRAFKENSADAFRVQENSNPSNMVIQEISSGVLDPNPVAKRTWQTKTNSESGYTAVSGDRLFVDTSSGTVTVTLPSSPAVGAFVRFVDVAGTFANNNLTIGRNSEKIMRSATDMTVSDNFSAFELVYSGSTHGWMNTEI